MKGGVSYTLAIGVRVNFFFLARRFYVKYFIGTDAYDNLAL